MSIQIEPGTTSREIAEALEEAGVIRSRWLFLAVRGLRPRTILMAGEYRFWRPLTVWQVFDKISRGQVEYHRLTIPEGLTRFEIADLVAAAGLSTREEFLAEAGQAHQIQGRFREAANLEGFLFPDTYYFTRNITAREFVQMMIDQ
ncbi:MAG: endolytic transglycosylase MltG, partial [Acidobacteria bacterium]|nr:endolytic transglycosylase MltG [Acidobacteriota bacterium]